MSNNYQQHPGMLARECLACGKNILISKPAGSTKWDKRELDATTPHTCSNNKNKKSSTTSSPISTTSYENKIADLTELVNQLNKKVDKALIDLALLSARVGSNNNNNKS